MSRIGALVLESQTTNTELSNLLWEDNFIPPEYDKELMDAINKEWHENPGNMKFMEEFREKEGEKENGRSRTERARN